MWGKMKSPKFTNRKWAWLIFLSVFMIGLLIYGIKTWKGDILLTVCFAVIIVVPIIVILERNRKGGKI